MQESVLLYLELRGGNGGNCSSISIGYHFFYWDHLQENKPEWKVCDAIRYAFVDKRLFFLKWKYSSMLTFMNRCSKKIILLFSCIFDFCWKLKMGINVLLWLNVSIMIENEKKNCHACFVIWDFYQYCFTCWKWKIYHIPLSVNLS